MLGKCQVAPPSETGSRAEAQRAGEAASPVSTQEGEVERGSKAQRQACQMSLLGWVAEGQAGRAALRTGSWRLPVPGLLGDWVLTDISSHLPWS